MFTYLLTVNVLRVSIGLWVKKRKTVKRKT